MKSNDTKILTNVNEEIGLKKVMKVKRGTLFRLTNGVDQMIFLDNTEIVLRLSIKTLIYINKKGIKETMKISNDLVSMNNEKFVRRYKYTLSILNYLKTNKKIATSDTSEPATIF